MTADIAVSGTLDDVSSKPYYGWIPTAAGNLSFGSLTAWQNTLVRRHQTSEYRVVPQSNGDFDQTGDEGNGNHKELLQCRLVIAHHQRITNDGVTKQILRAFLQYLPANLGLWLPRWSWDFWRPTYDAVDHFAVLFGSALSPSSPQSLAGKFSFLHRVDIAGIWLGVPQFSPTLLHLHLAVDEDGAFRSLCQARL